MIGWYDNIIIGNLFSEYFQSTKGELYGKKTISRTESIRPISI